MTSTDQNLPENRKANLDRKLDHALEETFPTSDPVSIAVTRGGAIDYDDEAGTGSGDWRSTAQDLAGQARDAFGGAAASATEAARGAYESGRRYAREARARYPDAERAYHEGLGAVRRGASGHPVVTLLLGAAIGFALGTMIRSARHDDDDHTADYERMDREAGRGDWRRR